MDPRAMVDLADRTRRAVVAGKLESALDAITGSAVDLGLCETAGVVRRVLDGRLDAVGAVDGVAAQWDRLQIELGQGPSIDALSTDGELLLSPTLATDARWPRWTAHAVREGIVSVVGIRLFAEDLTLGALTLYSTRARNYTHESLDKIRVVAAHASIALAHVRGTENLWRAIEARHSIGRAQGILMERFTVSTETALDILRRYSQDRQMKIREVAEHLIRTGSLPGGPPAGDANTGAARDGTSMVDGGRS